MLKQISIAFALATFVLGIGQSVAQSCPANSHATSSGNCVCDSGYVQSGGQCR
jgi:hypothetical protein